MLPFLSEMKGANNSDSWKTMWYYGRQRLIGGVDAAIVNWALWNWGSRTLLDTWPDVARTDLPASEGSRPDLAAPNSSSRPGRSCSSH
jgi:hypothetical protein